jgi:hypothetical protein
MISKRPSLLSLLLVAVLVTAIVTTVAVYAESKSNEGKDRDKGMREKDEGKHKGMEGKEMHGHRHSRIFLIMHMFFNDEEHVHGKALIRVAKTSDKFLLVDNINMVVHNPSKNVKYDNLYACFNGMNLGKMQLVEQSDEAVVLKLVDRKELPSDATITIPSPVKIVEGNDCVNGTVRYTAS